ncbi:hypothetical protein CDAR_107421 [Caerostris darwini]|uniref:Uncharacterized protein n=1 Tax=Caerostris darwini TaxID=1538125 RepID=A0AAV4NC03_9ARAC|nr:hypothetical protein CDAR_107421 [Caerostris darwini]
MIGHPGKTNLDILQRFVFHVVTRHSHYIETRTYADVVHSLKKTFCSLVLASTHDCINEFGCPEKVWDIPQRFVHQPRSFSHVLSSC